MESKVFDDDLDEKLIDLVRENSVLYDLSHKSYKDSMIKNNAWKKIGAELGKDGAECMTRWKTIRDSYRRNINKIKEKSTTGSPAFVKSKYMNKNLQFLDRTLKARVVKSNSRSDVNHSTNNGAKSETAILNETEVEEETCIESVENNSDDECEEEQEQTQKPTPPGQKRKRTSKDRLVDEFRAGNEERAKLIKDMMELKREKKQPKPNDPIDLFFQSMAETVKGFPANIKTEARMKVCQIISELELKAQQQQAPMDHTAQSPSAPLTINTKLIRPNFRVHTQNFDLSGPSSSTTASINSPSIIDNSATEDFIDDEFFQQEKTFYKL